MPIRVLLSDDESLARERLRSLLEEEPDIEIVAECGDGRSAISTIKRERPDLVFLDIQMPETDGFGVVSALRDDHMPLTIFVTAYDRYAMKAFEVHALDYLLKPIEFERSPFRPGLAFIARRRGAGFETRGEPRQRRAGKLDAGRR